MQNPTRKTRTLTYGEAIAPSEALARFITPERVSEAADRLGVVQRDRKVSVFALVWTLVLGFQSGSERTLEALRHVYQKMAGHSIVRSAFYTRLTAPLTKLLREVALEAMDSLSASAAAPRGYLAYFKELLAVDSSVIRLHEWLANTYAACRTNHTKAAAKLHAVINVLDGSPTRVKFTSERTSDVTPWKRVGQWLRGRLLLFDLGYYSFHLFNRIDQNGGFFLSRVKSNANLLITAVNRTCRGQAVPVVGQHLQDVLPRLQRQILDAQVEVTFKRRGYRGKQSTGTQIFRLVAVLNQDTGHYHCYITNVPSDVLAAEDFTRTYALRWQVEIFFKAMKHYGHLDQLPSRKQCVVECLVWASILSIIASQVLHRHIRRAISRTRHTPVLRWAALFARVAEDLLRGILVPDQVADDVLGALLVRDAQDPNVNRPGRAIDPQLCGLRT